MCRTTDVPKDPGPIVNRNVMPSPAGYIPPPSPRHIFPPDPNLPLKQHCQVRPAEGTTHLCSPFRSSEGGPGPPGRYTDSCQGC